MYLSLMWSVYDKDHMSALQIKNTSERISESLRISLGFIRNCLSYLTTAKISFNSTLVFIGENVHEMSALGDELTLSIPSS